MLAAGLTLIALAAAIAYGTDGILPLLGLALAVGLGAASFLPLRGRNLRRLPLAVWGMVIAHFGIAVALFGMASETAFSQERLAAVQVGGQTTVGPWSIELASVDPVAGPNWTAIEGRLLASYAGSPAIELGPQARSFWAPVQETTESVLATRWNGQLYAVIGNQAADGRWQLRLWWKPWVTLIWYGGLLVALGGVVALIGRLLDDLKRRSVRSRIAERRAEVSA